MLEIDDSSDVSLTKIFFIVIFSAVELDLIALSIGDRLGLPAVRVLYLLSLILIPPLTTTINYHILKMKH